MANKIRTTSVEVYIEDMLSSEALPILSNAVNDIDLEGSFIGARKGGIVIADDDVKALTVYLKEYFKNTDYSIATCPMIDARDIDPQRRAHARAASYLWKEISANIS